MIISFIYYVTLSKFFESSFPQCNVHTGVQGRCFTFTPLEGYLKLWEFCYRQYQTILLPYCWSQMRLHISHIMIKIFILEIDTCWLYLISLSHEKFHTICNRHSFSSLLSLQCAKVFVPFKKNYLLVTLCAFVLLALSLPIAIRYFFKYLKQKDNLHLNWLLSLHCMYLVNVLPL